MGSTQPNRERKFYGRKQDGHYANEEVNYEHGIADDLIYADRCPLQCGGRQNIYFSKLIVCMAANMITYVISTVSTLFWGFFFLNGTTLPIPA
jgi:hypothetical protein